MSYLKRDLLSTNLHIVAVQCAVYNLAHINLMPMIKFIRNKLKPNARKVS